MGKTLDDMARQAARRLVEPQGGPPMILVDMKDANGVVTKVPLEVAQLKLLESIDRNLHTLIERVGELVNAQVPRGVT